MSLADKKLSVPAKSHEGVAQEKEALEKFKQVQAKAVHPSEPIVFWNHWEPYARVPQIRTSHE